MAPLLTVNGDEVYKRFFTAATSPSSRRFLSMTACRRFWLSPGTARIRKKANLSQRTKPAWSFGSRTLRREMAILAVACCGRSRPSARPISSGEIHVLDPDVIPSSDRTDFEENQGRSRLARRCQRISSILRTKAGKESAMRRFDEAVEGATDTLAKREDDIKSGKVLLELKDEVAFEMKKIQEDLQKRMKGPKKPAAGRRAERLLKRTRKVLTTLQAPRVGFIDLSRELNFDGKLRALYETILQVLKEEFRNQPERLERIIGKIHEAVRARLTA